MNISAKWKTYLNQKKAGGFDSRKHPVYIETAINNAKIKFNDDLNIESTEVYKLAESFYPLVEKKINEALNQIASPPP